MGTLLPFLSRPPGPTAKMRPSGRHKRLDDDAIFARSFRRVQHAVGGLEDLLGRPAELPGRDTGADGDRGVGLGPPLRGERVAYTLGRLASVLELALRDEHK